MPSDPTNVSLRDFMDIRFKSLETSLTAQILELSKAIDKLELSQVARDNVIDELTDRMIKGEKKQQHLSDRQRLIYYVGSAVILISTALLIAWLTNLVGL